MNDGGPEGKEREWENIAGCKKQRVGCVIRPVGFLPVGPQGHRLTAAREKKEKKICPANHPTVAPPKQTH